MFEWWREVYLFCQHETDHLQIYKKFLLLSFLSLFRYKCRNSWVGFEIKFDILHPGSPVAAVRGFFLFAEAQLGGRYPIKVSWPWTTLGVKPAIWRIIKGTAIAVENFSHLLPPHEKVFSSVLFLERFVQLLLWEHEDEMCMLIKWQRVNSASYAGRKRTGRLYSNFYLRALYTELHFV